MFENNPNDRLTLDQIENHQWLKMKIMSEGNVSIAMKSRKKKISKEIDVPIEFEKIKV